jgi:hypothetical protein
MQFNCRHCGALIRMVGTAVGCPHGCKDPFPSPPQWEPGKLACPCCGECDLDHRLLPALLTLAIKAHQYCPSTEIEIVEGYRCETYNGNLRGVSKLSHMDGRAVDLRIKGATLDEMYLLARSVPDFEAGGIGLNDDGTMHVDVRVFPARWGRVDGKYMGLAASKLLGRRNDNATAECGTHTSGA